MKIKTLFTTSLLTCLLLIVALPAQSKLRIELLLEYDGTTPIAIVPFEWLGRGAKPLDMHEIIATNLHRSGQFAPVAQKDMLQQPHTGKDVNFQIWRSQKVKYVVVGRIELIGQDRYQVQFQLMSVETGLQMTGHSFQVESARLRRLSHHISDIIYEAITGERGAFDTYLAYITVTKDRKGQTRHRLAVSDSDGYNERILFDSSKPIMSPSWSPDGKHIAYVSFDTGRPSIYVQNIITEQTQRIAGFKGLNNAPSWSPNGRQLALTLSKDGNPEIYIMDVASRRLQRVTNNFAIDTEATWMPNGRSLIFTSDRGGKPQLYKVDIGSRGPIGQPIRLTYDGDYNARAAVSPDGKRVAMVHRVDGQFRIAVLHLETEQLSILTDARLDESPSFAPNGSMVIYASQAKNRGILSTVSADGRARQRFSFHLGDVREPAWSPFKPN